jgi:hypothetical protein
MLIEQIKANKALVKPLVENSRFAVSIKGGSFSFFNTFSSSELFEA